MACVKMILRSGQNVITSLIVVIQKLNTMRKECWDIRSGLVKRGRTDAKHSVVYFC